MPRLPANNGSGWPINCGQGAEARWPDGRGEVDVLAYMGFSVAHRTKLHSTNLLTRLNGEAA
jgi:hypothetical protein